MWTIAFPTSPLTLLLPHLPPQTYRTVAVGAMRRALDIYIDGGRFAIAAKAEKDIAEIYEAEGNLTDVRHTALLHTHS